MTPISMAILWTLQRGNQSCNTIAQTCELSSRYVAYRQLRQLEAAGLVVHEDDKSSTYRLSEAGQEIIDNVLAGRKVRDITYVIRRGQNGSGPGVKKYRGQLDTTYWQRRDDS